jgi:molybdopterin molybdotransferase
MSATDACGEAHRPLASMDQAMDLLLSHARPVAGTERVQLLAGLGRVLAEPLFSPIAVPPWDNSAMDGYALRTADLGSDGAQLRVTQRIPAGRQGRPLGPGEAARIFTGAPVPPGADAVVMQEVCTRTEDAHAWEGPPGGEAPAGGWSWVRVPAGLEPGANIRRAGEDMAPGAKVISAGTRLDPQHLGLAASVGVAELTVCRRLRVAVFSSGDELANPGEALGPGQIYNSNRYTLGALVAALGCEAVDLGIIPDTLDATLTALADAAARADLILASGGVSVGEEDHVKPAVERLGSLELWQIAMRPGKPLAFGHVAGTPFIGSPGNPVSLFVTACLFARPFILRRQGVSGPVRPQALTVRAGFDWPRPDSRRELHRARLETGPDGDMEARVHPSRSAGVLSSVTWANGLVVIAEGRILRRGDPVPFIPFSELLR